MTDVPDPPKRLEGFPHLNAVASPDATHGWAVGGFGTILSTANGGLPLAASMLTSVAPPSTPVDTTVAITGSCLTRPGSAALNGVAAAKLTPLNATRIKAIVRTGAASGPLTAQVKMESEWRRVLHRCPARTADDARGPARRHLAHGQRGASCKRLHTATACLARENRRVVVTSGLGLNEEE